MICISLGRECQEELVAEHRRLVAEGAPLVELRLDYLRGPVDVAALLANRPGPVVVTCRRPSDGGKYTESEHQRLDLLRQAVAAGAEYVDLEEDTAKAIPREGGTKRIISYHDFDETPDNLVDIHRRLCGLNADVVKVCTTALHPGDNLRLLELTQRSAVPTVAFCMGETGIPSRILAGRFGAPLTYAAPDAKSVVAPGQIPFAVLRDLYRYDQINAQTEVYGVIADPVGHSLSPLIHNTGFGHLQLNKVYVPLRIPPADLHAFLDQAPRLGLRGLSVTIPHKETILPKLAWAEESVRGIGACNTAVLGPDGWHGYNTDCQAALETLEEAAGGRKPDAASPLAGKTALLLGSGGVGKAIAFGLLQRGAKVALCDGMPQRSEDLATRLGCQSIPWGERHSLKADVLINGTPVGMHPKVDETPFEKRHLRSGMIVFDAVYNPEYTRLLQDAQARGCKVVTGVEMFVRQACMQFKMFTEQTPPVDLMRGVIKKALGVG